MTARFGSGPTMVLSCDRDFVFSTLGDLNSLTMAVATGGITDARLALWISDILLERPLPYVDAEAPHAIPHAISHTCDWQPTRALHLIRPLLCALKWKKVHDHSACAPSARAPSGMAGSSSISTFG